TRLRAPKKHSIGKYPAGLPRPACAQSLSQPTMRFAAAMPMFCRIVMRPSVAPRLCTGDRREGDVMSAADCPVGHDAAYVGLTKSTAGLPAAYYLDPGWAGRSHLTPAATRTSAPRPCVPDQIEPEGTRPERVRVLLRGVGAIGLTEDVVGYGMRIEQVV